MSNNSYYDNRELSWLKFNLRVLEEAENPEVPLFERFRFASIFASNLDEFFMVRVGSLYDKAISEKSRRDYKTGLSPREQLSLIADRVAHLMPRFNAAYREIEERLALCGVAHITADRLTERDKSLLMRRFVTELQPHLFPSVIDKNRPLPLIPNKTVCVLAELSRKKKEYLGLVTAVSAAFPRVFFLPSEKGARYVLSEEVISLFAGLLFPDYSLKRAGLVRITRNADSDINGIMYRSNSDYMETLGSFISARKQLCPVRIEYSENISEKAAESFAESAGLALGDEFVFRVQHPLDFGFADAIEEKLSDDKALFYERIEPAMPCWCSSGERVIEAVRRQDRLLMYPFQSIEPFLSLLNEAAASPETEEISITLYRAAKNSRVVEALCNAAKAGKRVLALVELRARFDEEKNMRWAAMLEEAGVKVIFGPDELKVHSKLLLIKQRINGECSYITQIGTGNYNEKTARQYTDITLMTADREIALDAEKIFSALLRREPPREVNCLLTAPYCMKNRILEMIEREIVFGNEGYIGLKLNALTDKDIMDRLVKAGKCGVKIELLIRGACCLIGGIEGETDNIAVVSVVGRFLEHSRIYIFGRAERKRVYISSADFMTRNTERRVEVAAPIKDPMIITEITEYFLTMMSDNVKARVQQRDGTYLRRETSGEPLDGQIYYCEKAQEQAAEAILTTQKSRSEHIAKAEKIQQSPAREVTAQKAHKEKKGLFKRILSFLGKGN